MAVEDIVYRFEVLTDDALQGLDKLDGALASIQSGFSRAGSLSKSFSNAIKKTLQPLESLTKVASAFTGVALGKELAEGTKEAIDFYETLNLFQVAMKDSSDVGNEFVDSISEWYGLDPKNLMQYTGTFYEMAYAVGAPDEAARSLSTSLTALSVDLASLFNTDVETVTDNLTSGLRGSSRAVVKYGLDLRATTVEAFANAHGITEQYETMNEASREILRYATAVTQARDATGDFARTLEQPANQLRVFKEQAAQLGRAIGTFVVKPLKEALPVINGFVMALNVMLTTMAELFGFSLMEDYEAGFVGANSAMEELGDTADENAKKIKRFIAPFDELNVIQDNSSSDALGFGEVDPALLKLLDDMQYSLEEVRLKAADTRDAILKFFGFVPGEDGWIYSPAIFEEQLMAAFPQWQSTIAALFDLDGDVVLGNIRLLFYEFGVIAQEAIFGVMSDLASLFGIEITDTTLSDWIEDLNEKFINLRTEIWKNKDEISGFLTKALELVGILLIAAPVLEAFGAAFFALSGAASLFGIGLDLINGLATITGTVFSNLAVAVGLLGTLAGSLAIFFNNVAFSIGATTTEAVVWGAQTSTLTGTIQSLFYGLSSLSGVFVTLAAVAAAVFVGGFIKWAATSDEFKEHLSRWGESLSGIFDSVRIIFMYAWETFMKMVDRVAIHFSGFFDGIAGIVSGLLQIFDGLFKVLAGLFTNDLSLILAGGKKIFYGFCNAVNSLIGGMVNLGITALNWLIQKMTGGIINALNAVISGAASLLSFVGIDLNFRIPSVPMIPQMKIQKIPEMATGGVVTGPTRALIGEGAYSEAVIPLENSPQMRQLVERIADAVEKRDTNGSKPVEVHVYLDSREVTSAQNKTNRMYGRTQQNM